MSETTGLTFTDNELKLIRKSNDRLDDAEFSAFITAAKRYGLNPLANQIYTQVRQTKARGKSVTTVVQIDGYRLLADRTGQLAGNDDPVFTHEECMNSDDMDIKATVTVHKMVDGEPRPFTASARWKQYCPSPPGDFMWRKMPHLMLGKCAEALALRKAFPAELSGIYTHEEMEQAASPTPTEPPPVAEETDEELRNLTHELQSVMIEIDATRDPPVGIQSMSAEEFAKLIIEKKNHGNPLTKLVLDDLLKEEKAKAAKIRQIAHTKKKPEPTLRTDSFLALVDYVSSQAKMSMDDSAPHVLAWLERSKWTKLSLNKQKVADAIWEAAKKVDWTTIRAEKIPA